VTGPFLDAGGLPIRSVTGLNRLPEPDRLAAYRTLLPDEVFARFGVDPAQAVDDASRSPFTVRAAQETGSVEVQFRHRVDARDPVVFLHLADTPNNQIIVLLFVVNDPESPRFDVDRNWSGEPTKFGTLSRNIDAEIAAMQAGLTPGQVRRGLRLSRKLLEYFETFVSRLGRDMFLLEPLAYHTAILFERYGCAYSQGLNKMNWIHRAFGAGGELVARLNGSTPFRMPGAEKTVRGRSWAIQDGILGEPFVDVHMYKRVGRHASVNTFPEAVW